MTASFAERLCAVAAAGARQDPIGSAGSTPRLMAVETPTPWGDELYTPDPAGSLAQKINAVRASWIDEMRSRDDWEEQIALGLPGLYGIQPDREWSRNDVRRVLLAIRPEGLISEYDMAEYAFPFDSPQLVDFAWAFFNAPATLGDFESFRIEHAGWREFFVCTHGHVDICCAKFGIPLYNRARAAYPRVRAWRTTHFGGHRYAPTAWEFPAAYKWAFLDERAAGQVIDRSGDAVGLAMNLRGWNGAQGQSQLLDREGLKRHGWYWLDFKRRGVVTEAEPEAQRWRVTLDFESPEGERGRYEGTVVVGRELKEIGCGQHAGDYDFQVPEYALESFTDS